MPAGFTTGWFENFDQQQDLRIVVERQQKHGAVHDLPFLILIAVHRLNQQPQLEPGVFGIPILVCREATSLPLELAKANGWSQQSITAALNIGILERLDEIHALMEKRFADDETKKFVNGILDKILKEDQRLQEKRNEIAAEPAGVKRDA